MNKEKIIKFFKNPFNVLFIILLIITIIIYSKDLFVDSIWLDETSYIWDAQLIKENPLYLLKMGMYHFPDLVIAFYNLFFKSFIAGRLMGLSFGLLGIIFIFLLGRLKNSFIGFTAALLLAFHYWYRFLTMKALVDAPLTAMIIIFTYFLYKFEEKINIKNSIILFIVGLATITSKASGIFVIALAIIYLFICFVFFEKKKKLLIEKLKQFKFNIKSIIIIIIFLISIFFSRQTIIDFKNNVFTFLKSFQLNTLIPKLGLLPDLLSWTIIILSIIGLIIIIFYKSKKLIILALPGLLFLFFSLFFYKKVPELRYILPILPSFYLISAFFIDEIINYVKMFIIIPKLNKYLKLILRVIVLIIIFFIIVKPYYILGNQIIENKNWAYTGYIEAMSWVSDNIKTSGGEYKGMKDVYIPNFFACCSYNVGLDRDDIRRVNWSGLFNTFEEFKEFVEREDNINETIYLMPDMWEPGQISWLYPMTQEKFNNIVSLGFNLVKVVERPYPTNEGIKNIPVIFIFKRN